MNSHARISQAAVWDTADKYLRNVVEPEEYGDYIIPFLVLRRLECLLANTKDEVLAYLARTSFPSEHTRDMMIRRQFKLSFYNTQPLDLKTIGDVDDHVEDAMNQYIDGFSSNIADIWAAFKFPEKLDTLARSNRLLGVVKHFSTLQLHPDNMSATAMGDLFEDVMYRAFSSKGKGAGAFYTPRDAIALMVDILFASDDEGLRGKAPSRSIYDPAAGTGGMLLVAARALHDLNPSIDVSLFGQEMMDWAYAIGKADLLIQGGKPDSIRQENTLTTDLFAGETFDYVMSNPPYGSDWSADAPSVRKEAASPGSRFSHGLPATSDGQMLFLQHVVAKMAPAGEGGAGGRAGVVMNGSPLFTGGPGSGPDSIRAWLLTEDLVDAIIALPTSMFYGTGIATYIWILDKNKEPHRQGKIQLLDSTGKWHPMRKGMGDKRREMTEADRAEVLAAYTAFEDSEISKIVTADDLGYRDVPVYRTRHYATSITPETIDAAMTHASAVEAHRDVIASVATIPWNALPKALTASAKANGVKMTTGLIDHIMTCVAVDEPSAPAAVDRKGKLVLADGSKMTERITLAEDITEHMRTEVLPFAPDVQWDEAAAKVGYEIPMTRLFYKPTPTRPLAEIDADVTRLMADLAAKFARVRA